MTTPVIGQCLDCRQSLPIDPRGKVEPHACLVAVAVVIERNERFAAIFHARRRGVELPGGKIDPGETPEGAAIREVREEVGLEVTALHRLDVTTVGGCLCLLFVAAADGELRASTEGEPFWATRADLLKAGSFPEHTARWLPRFDLMRTGLL